MPFKYWQRVRSGTPERQKQNGLAMDCYEDWEEPNKKKTYKPNMAMSEDEIRAKFSTEAKARKYYEKIIWGGKPKCPHCGSIKTGKWCARAGWHRCYTCRKLFTVRMGTIMQCTRIPLRKWLLAEYYKVTARKGISSLELSKKLGVAYKSALFLHYRLCCVIS